MARLREEPSRAQSLIVRFPAGWSRPVAGSYATSEELVVIEGSLTLSGEVYVPGDWAFLPAGWLRDGTDADGHVLAYARFGGPARWTRGAGAPDGVLRAQLDPATLGSPTESPLGSGDAWLLRDGDDDQAWCVTGVRARTKSPVNAEIYDLDARAWTFTAAGGSLPKVAGTAFCRTFVYEETTDDLSPIPDAPRPPRAQ